MKIERNNDPAFNCSINAHCAVSIQATKRNEKEGEKRYLREARDFGECAEEVIFEPDLIESSVDQEVTVLVVELVAMGVVGEGVGEVVADRVVVEMEAGVFRLVNTTAVVVVVVVKAAAATAEEEDREGEGEEGDVEEVVGVVVVGAGMVLGVLTPAARAARRWAAWLGRTMYWHWRPKARQREHGS